MNAPRRNKVVTAPASHEMDGWLGILRSQLNNILIVILVIAAIAMFIRWRMKTAEMNKQAVGNELANARSLIRELRSAYPQGSPADFIKAVQTLETNADAAISTVLNSSDATAALRAQAFVSRGDLYWELANLPALGGAASEPTLRLSESSDALLQKSFDAYSEVIKNSTYADQHESLNQAHLGLAAIAENRGDWKTAQNEFQAVIDDSNSMPVLADQARLQLLEVPTLQKAMYVAPPSGIGPTTLPVATNILGPIGPIAPLHLPTTASTQPVMMPAAH